MLFDTVAAYTENDIAVFKESVTVIPESLCLQRAAGRIIFRIEIQNHFFPFIVGKRNIVSAVSGESK